MNKLIHKISLFLSLSRVHVLTGKWFVIVPAFWGLTIAHKGIPPIEHLIFFTLGAFLLSVAGCTMNDIIDRNFDNKVKRTKNRPLAANELSVTSAYLWFVIQITLAGTLLFFMNIMVWKMAIVALLMILIYPWLKRYTYWPQLFLGFAMNYSMLMAYAYVTESLNYNVIILYIGSIFWTLSYDTIYAHQDKDDDVIIGIKSLALLWGKNTKLFATISYCCFMLSLLFVIYQIGLSLFTILVYLSTVIISVWQVISLDINNKLSCAKIFRCNNWIGFFVWITLIIAYKFHITNP